MGWGLRGAGRGGERRVGRKEVGEKGGWGGVMVMCGGCEVMHWTAPRCKPP